MSRSLEAGERSLVGRQVRRGPLSEAARDFASLFGNCEGRFCELVWKLREILRVVWQLRGVLFRKPPKEWFVRIGGALNALKFQCAQTYRHMFKAVSIIPMHIYIYICLNTITRCTSCNQIPMRATRVPLRVAPLR